MESVIDSHVAFVDYDAEVPKDRSDGAKVIEGAMDVVEAGEVDDDVVVKARWQCSVGRKGKGGA